jgi:hypothetical protein
MESQMQLWEERMSHQYRETNSRRERHRRKGVGGKEKGIEN